MNGQPETLLQTTVIAALLHDVGVVAQRAQDPAQPTTDHAPLAAAFAAARAPVPFRAASAAILGHHRPDDRATRIVAAADCLAAGGPDDEDPVRPALQRRSSLAPSGGAPRARPPAFYEVNALTTDLAALTPKPTPSERDDVRRRLGTLSELFATEHTAAASPDFATYVEGLLDLLHRIGWAVPAPTRDGLGDASLAAHLHVAGAIAACLERDQTADETLTAILNGEPEALTAPRALLAHVQLRTGTFFDSGDTVEAVRGRAALLAELHDAIASWLLRRLDLPPCNIIPVISSDVVILAPLASERALAEARGELQRRLLAVFGGHVIARLTVVPITGDDLGRGGGRALAKLHDAVADQRGRAFGGLSMGEQTALFQPRGSGGPSVGCRQCPWFGRPEGDRSCTLCADSDALGSAIATAEFVLRIDTEATDGQSGSLTGALASFGRVVQLVADTASLPELPKGAVRAKLARLRTVGVVDPAIRAWVARQSAPVAVVSQPNAIGPVTGAVDGAVELRADALSRLWSDGSATAPLADLVGAACLARLFFHVAASDAARRTPNAQAALIRSDGLGAVWAGSWRALPDLAAGLREAFRAFVGDSASARCSAVVVAIDDRPVGQVLAEGRAALASRAARWSKAAHGPYHRGPVLTPSAAATSDQNAITVTDWTMSWDEFQLALQRYQRLRNLVALRNVSRRVLQTFAVVEQRSRSGSGSRGRVTYGPWLWQAAQQLRRAPNLPDADANEFLSELQRADGIARMALAAQWAERATRPSAVEERA